MSRLLTLFALAFLEVQRAADGSRMSGLYLDNSLGQTVAHRVISLREKRDIARDILNFLELPMKTRIPANETPPVSGSALNFMYDVYRNAVGENKAGSFDFTEHDLKAIRDSDVIMTYSVLPNGSNANYLRFDLSETPKIDHVIRAELHLYPKTTNKPFMILVHSISNSSKHKNRLRLVSSMNITNNHEGWIKINVTETVRYWFRYPKRNQGLHLSIIDPRRTLIDAENDVDFSNQVPEMQPFLVAYFEGSETLSNQRTDSIRWRRSSVFSSPAYLDNPYVSRDSPRRRQKSGACSLRSLYVRFRDLEFDNFIVAPDGYNAQYCSGECRFPLNAHMNATNHAIVRTLVHFLLPGQAPQACCAPRELGHLPVLYSRDGINHVLKRYRNMVIKSCGCH